MRRVLFVLDETGKTEALRRTLRPVDGEWEVTLTGGAAAALARLRERPFDAVVSDTGAVDGDGSRLLSEVRRLHPQVLRIVLSARADLETVMRSFGVAHQHLPKPCTADALRQTVERACALRDLLSNESLRKLVSQMPTLPSLPSLYTQLVEELRRPDASVKRVGRIISRDIGMTAKMLQLVNSAFFGLRRPVSDPAEAARLLGLDTVLSLVLSVSVFTQFGGGRGRGFSADGLWSHSLRVGAFARAIARAEGQGAWAAEDCFTAGLLHDAGVLILAHNLPEWHEEAVTLMRADGLASEEAERMVFGTTHAEVGAYLLGLWGLAYNVVEAVAFHDDTERCRGRNFDTLTAVWAANQIAHHSRTRGGEAVPSGAPTSPAVSDPRLREWGQVCGRVADGEGRTV